jgi:argininosuccinate lyase
MQQSEMAFSAARLAAPPSDHVKQFYQLPGLMRERRQFSAFSRIDLAHTVMLVERGILSQDIGRQLLPVLLEIRELGYEGLDIDAARGSLLFQIEAFLAARLGEDVAGALHTARSRIDQSATARRLFKREGLLRVMENVLAVTDALIDVAAHHRSTIMPYYTHMQQAQPGNFGHYLLSFVSRLEADFDRCVEVFSRVNLSPLGAVGLCGTSWPIDRSRTAELLGFDGLVYNSKLGREAYYAAEIAASLSFIMSDLNDLATDLHIWSSNEFSLVELDDSYCSTSSIFPQKKNPVTLETIKGAAGSAVTWFTTALATFRGEGTGDQAIRSVGHLDAAFDTVSNMLELTAGILTTLTVNHKRIDQLLDRSWSTSSNLADVLVQGFGLSFRQAHHVVGRLVRIAIIEGIERRDVTTMLVSQAALETIGEEIQMSEAELASALDPKEFVRACTSAGSVGPGEIDHMLELARASRIEHEGLMGSRRQQLATADEKLDHAVRSILG